MPIADKLQTNTGESVVITIMQLHLQLLNAIETNLEGVKVSDDPEFLHDLRVAIRRVRSTFNLIRAMFPPQQASYFRTEFAWLQQITGATRDLQVQELALNSYRSELPQELNEALDPWANFLASQHVAAKLNLIQELKSNRLKVLLVKWRDTVTALNIAYATTDSLQKILSSRLRELHRHILKDGKSISTSSDAESYHDLRKLCKKLRYLLESFRDRYDPTLVKLTLKQVRILLDALGNYQDVVVQTNMLLNNRNNFVSIANSERSSAVLDTLFAKLQQRKTTIQVQVFDAFAVFSAVCGRPSFDTLLHSYA